MKEPLVSICCVAYNHEQYIKDALESFMSQKTTFPIEIVVSDDCSKDGTHAIIKEYVEKFPDLFRDISPKQNLGLFENFTYVQEQARGKYIAICEGDDFWIDPYKLQKQVDILEADESLMACCTNCINVDKTGKEIVPLNSATTENIQCDKRYTLRDFFSENHQYPTLTVVYRNSHKEELYSKLRHTKNPFLADWPLWIILLTYGDMLFLNQKTAAYRNNPTSITHTANRVARAKTSIDICCKVADILPEEYSDIAADLRKTNWVWISLIFAYKAEKRYFGMLGSFIMAAIMCPKSLWQTIKGALTKRKNK